MTPLIVSFYAGDACYEVYAQRLRRGCEALGLDHLIVKLSTHLDTWVEITNLKGRFLRHVMRKVARPILWVDADGEVLQLPTLLIDTDVDFAVFARTRKWKWKPIGRRPMELPKGWPDQMGPKWFLSGTVFLNRTKGAMNLLEEWARRAKADMRGYEQYMLQEAWCETRPSTFWLPEEYCQVRKRKPGTVIVHEFASCKQKNVVRA